MKVSTDDVNDDTVSVYNIFTNLSYEDYSLIDTCCKSSRHDPVGGACLTNALLLHHTLSHPPRIVGWLKVQGHFV